MTLEDMPVQDEMSTSRPGRSGRVPADRRSKKPTVELDQARAVAELVRVAREQGDALTGPTGLLKKVTAMVLQAALEADMTEHLGHAKHQVPDAGSNAVADPDQDGMDDAVVNEARNVRNGSRVKTVLTDSAGEVMLRVPRDRAGSFEPVIVARHQRKLGSLDTMVMSLTAKGLTSGEISGHLQEIYGASVSKDTICRITDTILEEMHEWATRPQESIYAAILIDAIVVKVKDGQVANRPFYAAIGVTVEGRKDVLGLWAGTPEDGEGAKYWMAVLMELKNRGVADVMFVVCDGLKGLPDSIEAVWPYAIVQTCVIHLLRNSFRLTSRKYWDQIARDLKLVYTAPSPAAARAQFDVLTATWGQQYPALIRLWENAWEQFTPFLAYDVEIRRILFSTNAIESLNARYRRAVSARGHFPSEQSALKCLYLVTRSLDPTGKGATRWTMRWKPAPNVFATTFEGRWPTAEKY